METGRAGPRWHRGLPALPLHSASWGLSLQPAGPPRHLACLSRRSVPMCRRHTGLPMDWSALARTPVQRLHAHTQTSGDKAPDLTEGDEPGHREDDRTSEEEEHCGVGTSSLLTVESVRETCDDSCRKQSRNSFVRMCSSKSGDGGRGRQERLCSCYPNRTAALRSWQ